MALNASPRGPVLVDSTSWPTDRGRRPHPAKVLWSSERAIGTVRRHFAQLPCFKSTYPSCVSNAARSRGPWASATGRASAIAASKHLASVSVSISSRRLATSDGRSTIRQLRIAIARSNRWLCKSFLASKRRISRRSSSSAAGQRANAAEYAASAKGNCREAWYTSPRRIAACRSLASASKSRFAIAIASEYSPTRV